MRDVMLFERLSHSGNLWCSATSSVQPRRSSVALGIGWTGRSSSLTLGSHNIIPFDGSAESQDHMRIEQLEKRLVDTMQREASLNV